MIRVAANAADMDLVGADNTDRRRQIGPTFELRRKIRDAWRREQLNEHRIYVRMENRHLRGSDKRFRKSVSENTGKLLHDPLLCLFRCILLGKNIECQLSIEHLIAQLVKV